MAAIDPSEEIEVDDVDHKGPPRATLKVIRVADDMLDEEDDEDYSDEDDEDEGESDDEEVNGGPSDKKALLKALAADNDSEDEDDEMDEDDDDEADLAAIEQLKKLMKGKGKAFDGEEDDEDEDDESDEGIELDECVICTLDPEKVSSSHELLYEILT